jgi:hypothetical protein
VINLITRVLKLPQNKQEFERVIYRIALVITLLCALSLISVLVQMPYGIDTALTVRVAIEVPLSCVATVLLLLWLRVSTRSDRGYDRRPLYGLYVLFIVFFFTSLFTESDGVVVVVQLLTGTLYGLYFRRLIVAGSSL